MPGRQQQSCHADSTRDRRETSPRGCRTCRTCADKKNKTPPFRPLLSFILLASHTSLPQHDPHPNKAASAATVDHPPAYSSPTYGPAEPSSTGPPHHPYHQQPEIAPDHQTLHHPAYANDPISPQTTGPATYFKPQPDQHQHQHPMQEYKTSPPPQSPPHGPASPPPAHVHPHPTPVPTRGMHSSAANNPAGAAAQPIGLLTSAPAPVHCPSCGATAMTRPSVVTGNTTQCVALPPSP